MTTKVLLPWPTIQCIIKKNKHVELDIHFVQEKVVAKQFSIHFVPSNDQTANIFTKALNYGQFHYLRCKLNILLNLFSLKGDVREFSNNDGDIES